MNARIATAGFTLLELIVVVVLVGVLAGGAGLLISRPIEAYRDQQQRKELVDQIDATVRQIEADIRRALPNSLRHSSTGAKWSLEIIKTVEGGRYRDEAGGGIASADDILDFGVSGDDRFNLLGKFHNYSSLGYAEWPTFRVVIYNTDPSQVYADAANNNNPGVISPAGVTLGLDSTLAEHQLLLSSSHQFLYQSPGQRFYLVEGAVSYICDTVNGKLSRLSGYGYRQNQSSVDTVSEIVALGGSEALIARGLSQCSITYQPGSAYRAGLVTLDIAISNSLGETARVLHQIHVDNVP